MTKCFPSFVALLALAAAGQAATVFDLAAPGPFSEFGTIVKALPSGNIAVTAPNYRDPVSNAPEAGAVLLFNGRSGALISMLTGTHSNARVGNRITVLANGNFVVSGGVWNSAQGVLVGGTRLCSGQTGCSGQMTEQNSFYGERAGEGPGVGIALANGNYLLVDALRDNGSAVDAGSITLCNGLTGCVGTVSETNSLVGDNPFDQVGGTADPSPRGIVALPNGDYIVVNPRWNGFRGAVTYGNGTTGTVGVVSAANSLVGSQPNDQVGRSNALEIGVKPLANGKFVVGSSAWNGGVGAATLCPAAGCAMVVSPSNSLVGRVAGDVVGTNLVALTNGNYVVGTTEWDLSPSNFAAGAVTFCSGETGCIGEVTPDNSLVGTLFNDRIGQFGIIPLPNGNFFVKSPGWNFNRGAVTVVNGNTGLTGQISAANSIIGAVRPGIQDRVGERQHAVFPNGDFVLGTERWFEDRGAVTYVSGGIGLTGEITAANSLVGSTTGDRVGSAVTALANGNYVASTPTWDLGPTTDVGAVTFCRGDAPCVGPVSAANSLYGSAANDRVSNALQRPVALPGGNYVVLSRDWGGGRGAVTWANGNTGLAGPVTPLNSFVGSSAASRVASEGIKVLNDGNFVINSPGWDNGAVEGAGAITWANGETGIVGEISTGNSLFGVRIDDFVGLDGSNPESGGGVYAYPDGSYIVRSRYVDNGTIGNSGALSLGRPGVPTFGPIGTENSIRGTISVVPTSGLAFDYDGVNRQMIVGLNLENRVTVFRHRRDPVPFDFDGDGRSDISIFRPPLGQWWIDQSTGGVIAHTFGNNADLLVPADFTGDAKTDVAVWRNGTWFVLRSEDFSFFAFPFGAAGDTPVPGDYDGDGLADAAVFRSATSTWFVRLSSGGTTIRTFGSSDDVPVPSDYDGDGRCDVAIWRPSLGQWWIDRSTAGLIAVTFGIASDRPVPGDHTGDGKTDIAVFRPTTGEWFILRSEDSTFYSFPFGAPGDIPAPADYDGDRRTDAAVFRPSAATWYLAQTSSGVSIRGFGLPTDIPVPR